MKLRERGTGRDTVPFISWLVVEWRPFNSLELLLDQLIKGMIEVRIQHHPSRVRHLDFLLNSLKTDIKHRVKVSVIEDMVSTWNGCKKALDSKADYICVLQDDTLASKDFLPTLERLVEVIPDKPITLFSTKDILNTAKLWGRNWATIKLWFYAQAYILPRDLAQDFIEFGNEHCQEKCADDERLAVWLYKRNYRVWATCPSLIEHLGFRSTTISTRQYDDYLKIERRVASNFIGFENSGLDIDWTNGIETPVLDEKGDWAQIADFYKE